MMSSRLLRHRFSKISLPFKANLELIQFRIIIIAQIKMEKRYGVYGVRKCSAQEQKLIKQKYMEMEKILEENRSDILYWANIYVDEQFCWQSKEKELEFHQMIQKLILQLQNGKEHYIVSYGFINNPKENKKHQNFHFDYDKDVTTIFIPLANFIYENSTQFLAYEPPCQPVANDRGGIQRFATSELQLLQRSNRDFITVSQVICKPFVILKMEPGTCHRGIANSGNFDRPAFVLHYCKSKIETYYQSKVDKF